MAASQPAEGEILIAGRDVIPNYMRLCFNITGKTIATRRNDAVKFLAAESEGLAYATAHRDETIRLAQQLSGSKPDDPRPAFVYDESVSPKLTATWEFDLDYVTMARFARLVVERGLEHVAYDSWASERTQTGLPAKSRQTRSPVPKRA